MPLEADLNTEVAKIFREVWTARNGTTVPEPEDLALGNDGVNLDAAVLYADINGSTSMVDNYSAQFAAEVYKAYLVCAARIIKSEGGAITAYDGDRVMGIFIGPSKNTSAARTALKINYAVQRIVNPKLKAQYPKSTFVLRHTVGVDTSSLLAARIGVRNDNDIVWVGRAANYAAKLSNIDDADSVFISAALFNNMNASMKTGGTPRRDMWTSRTWTQMGGSQIYSSDWWYRIDAS